MLLQDELVGAAVVRRSPFPRSLLACLPLLWQQVLFPGRAPLQFVSRRWVLLVVFVVPAVLLYPCLSFHLFEPDEGRYAQIPREMLQRGEWVVPHLQGEPYLDKPPLLYWLVMGSYRLLGVHDWSARLVPALAVHGSVLLAYFLGRRLLGERSALWGSLALALAPGFMSVGRLLVLDGLLTFLMTLSLLAAFEAVRGPRLHRGWWLLAAMACGLGVLTKGPVALVLLAPPLWLQRRLEPGGARVGLGALLAFAGIVLAVALPWYVAVCVRLPEFASYFLWQHNVMRFLKPFDHLEPVWYYLPVLLLGLLPSTLLIPSFLRFLLLGDRQTAEKRCPELGFLLLAGGWCVLFFSLSGSKLPTYVLPAFPPLALTIGYFIANSRWQHSRWPVAGAGLTLALLCVGHHVLVPWYAWYRSPMCRPDEVRALLADPQAPVVCYPRHVDSLAFYLGRDDLRNIRSREIEQLRWVVRQQPRTVILCTHRSSLAGLRQALPPEVHIVEEKHFGLGPVPGVPESVSKKLAKLAGETPFGLCDIAVIEMRP